MLLDATHYVDPFGLPPAERCLTPNHWVAQVPIEQAIAAKMGSKSDALEAYCDLGRWVVECPDCGGAQLVAKSDPRFMCVECGNASIGVKWRPVTFPAELKTIVGHLEAREIAKLQNWYPGETAADLKFENELLEYLAAVDPEAEARRWEGHTHSWPKRASDGFKTCAECSLTLPTDIIAEGEAAA